MVRLEKIADVARQFVLVRLVRITGVDLRIFEFDYDLTWAGFFVDPEGRVLGRYGGRDASGPDARISLAGLRYAMQAALEAHRRPRRDLPTPPAGKPLLAEEYPAARRLRRGECIHCHQVAEFQRAQRQAEKSWDPRSRWTFPLPETIGLTLEVDRGNIVRAILPGSPAALAGLRPGDRLTHANEVSLASQADLQFALHRSPWEGTLHLAWLRNGTAQQAKLTLPAGWKKSNLTWRPSLLDLLPSLPLEGEDLSATEKHKLALQPSHLAVRLDADLHAQARNAGLRPRDILLGIDGGLTEGTLARFLAHVRQEYLIGDRLTFLVHRDGKLLRLPWILR